MEFRVITRLNGLFSVCQCQAQMRGALTHFPRYVSVCLSLSLGSSPPWVATAGDILDSSSGGREIGGGGSSGEEEGDSAVRSATGRSSSWAGPPTASSSPSPRQPRVSGEDGCLHHGSSLFRWVRNNSKPQLLSSRHLLLLKAQTL